MQHFGSAQQSLWMHLANSSGVAQRAKSIPKWRHTHREPPGGPLTPFLSRSNEGRSNRIREHTGALNTVARKKVLCFKLKFEWVNSWWRVHIKCSAFSILVDTNSKLSCQQGNDRMYKCSCTCLYNGASETLSRKFTKGYKSCHCHSLHTLMRLNTSTHCCINIYLGTRITPVTAPIRNGYFYIKPIPLALWKREEYGVQTLKKVKFINCHTTWVSMSVFTLSTVTSHWVLFYVHSRYSQD